MKEDSTRISPRDDSVATAISYTFRFIFGGSFLGLALIFTTYQVPHRVADILGLVGGICLAWNFNRGSIFTIGTILIGIAGFLAAEFAARGLAGLAANGLYGPDKSGGSYFAVENWLIFSILWLLVGIPYRAFKYKIDQSDEGSTRRVMLKAITRVAAVLTGAFILILHYGHGPLELVDIKALIAGCVFTVFLILPIYETWAKKCWRRGFIGAFSLKPLAGQWREASRGLVADTENYWQSYYSLLGGEISDSESSREDKGEDRQDSPGKRRQGAVPVSPHQTTDEAEKAPNPGGTHSRSSVQRSSKGRAPQSKRELQLARRRNRRRLAGTEPGDHHRPRESGSDAPVKSPKSATTDRA